MPVTDVFNQLEIAVVLAQSKQKALNEASSALSEAQKEYNEAVTVVEDLKNQLTDAIGNIFPSPQRIKVSVA